MANYLKRPSIFEIATAYEDGNNGYVSKQDEYEKVYNQLSEEEKSLSWRHPFLAMEIKENRDKAFRATSHFDGITDGYGDAIRHCYWCALNQISAGLNSPNAKKFGDAHEDIPNNHAKAMDLHNNSVGYYLGNQAIINDWSEEELLNQVINAANNGKLYILK
jgi:hypothetical protein